MNKKSILYIFVVLMALSLTLSAVSAEDAVADDIVAAEEAPAIALFTVPSWLAGVYCIYKYIVKKE